MRVSEALRLGATRTAAVKATPAAQARKRIKRAGLDGVIPNVSPKVITENVPETQWVKVSPDLAIKWLEEANTNNRRIREDYVARLAADMLSGRWDNRNGESIGFDVNGRLVDGQHRLWACVQANKPFETLLVTGLSEASYSTKGIGQKKSMADFLGPNYGEKNAAILGSSLRLVNIWLKGGLGKTNWEFPTIPEMEQTYRDHPNLSASVSRVVHIGIRLLNQTYAVLIHYSATLNNHSARVESFLERLESGLGLLDNDPVYHLRKFLLSQRGTQPGHRRAARLYVLALAIKAWSYAKEEKPMKNLRFAAGEEFPQL